MIFLDGNPITWQSSKQKVVALSSCEAKYITAASTACQGVWLAQLLSDMLSSEPNMWILKVDNKSTISLVKNPVHRD